MHVLESATLLHHALLELSIKFPTTCHTGIVESVGTHHTILSVPYNRSLGGHLAPLLRAGVQLSEVGADKVFHRFAGPCGSSREKTKPETFVFNNFFVTLEDSSVWGALHLRQNSIPLATTAWQFAQGNDPRGYGSSSPASLVSLSTSTAAEDSPSRVALSSSIATSANSSAEVVVGGILFTVGLGAELFAAVGLIGIVFAAGGALLEELAASS